MYPGGEKDHFVKNIHCAGSRFLAKRIAAVICALTLALVMVSCSSGGGDGSAWTLALVEDHPDHLVGDNCVIAVDSSGTPHIAYSYYDTTATFLKRASLGTSGWSAEPVDPGSGVHVIDMGIDGSDVPHIVYQAGTGSGRGLYHAEWNDPLWDIGPVESGTQSSAVALVIDESDNIHLAYYDAGPGEVRYKLYNGTWGAYDTVDTNTNYYGLDIALESSSKPCVAYEIYTPPEYLWFARLSGGSWNGELVDDSADQSNGRAARLVIDSSDTAHIVYYSLTSGDDELRYARSTAPWDIATFWDVETLATGTMRNSAMDMDDAGNLHVAYYEHYTGLNYLRYDGSSWTTELVDPHADCDTALSLAVDSLGRVHIAYYDRGFDEECLRYAVRE
jgi:hypothetical protein